MQDEGTVAAAARLGTDILGPGLAKLAASHPSVGDVRGSAGCGPSNWSATGRPGSRSCRSARTGAANAPMTAVAKASLGEGCYR